MRVISGKYKRRLLRSTSGFSVTRPTSDRVKENTFNILAPEIAESTVIDLFSGSGALGIEALSRYAVHCVFVENHPEALQVLSENLQTLKVPEADYTIVKASVEDFLRFPKKYLQPSFKFAQLIFADPPYDSAWYNNSLEQLTASGLCADDCLAVIEMRASTHVKGAAQWHLEDERVYGQTRLELWRNGNETKKPD